MTAAVKLRPDISASELREAALRDTLQRIERLESERRRERRTYGAVVLAVVVMGAAAVVGLWMAVVR